MIGSNVVKLLHDCRVRDLKNGWDLRDINECIGMEGEVVFDLAAPTRGIGSNDFSDAARIPLNILAARPKHFVYASSSCVYPDDAPVPTPEHWGFSGSPETANEGYGWAKRAGELACKYSGIPCTVVRPSNIYGPSYDWSNPIKHVIPSLIERMLRGDDPLVVWGDGHQTRSFMYEEDCATLIVALSKHVGTFNLGGQEIRIGELVRILVELTGYKGEIVFDDSKPVGPRRKAQDTARIERILGKIVSTPLEEGLRKTVDAARNHRPVESAHRA